MCGIFGIVASDYSKVAKVRELSSKLFVLSEMRGKESSGFLIYSQDQSSLCKSSIPATQLIEKQNYNYLIQKFTEQSQPLAMIAHSRLATNGDPNDNDNNQPVDERGWTIVHNGIITNYKELWKKYSETPIPELDTKVINLLLSTFILNEKISPEAALSRIMDEVEGTCTLGLLHKESGSVYVSTNNGSLYIAKSSDQNLVLFASEQYILERAIENSKFEILKPSLKEVLTFCLGPANNNHKEESVYINNSSNFKSISSTTVNTLNKAEYEFERVKNITTKLKRCSRCVLPESFPGITFDSNGVCSYCHTHKPYAIKPIEELEKRLKKNTKKDIDCLVTFSGGRDSSFGLHLLKKELGINVVAYSYDWGMLTDLGRRNQARMCGALGIEHILVSADIKKKRENIKKNVEAWIRRPQVGTIPLFMAGDKQFFYYAKKIQQQMNLGSAILCENPLEKTDFKSAFAGITPKYDKDNSVYQISAANKLKMISYYGKEFALNPSYFNSSIADTLGAFASYYLIDHSFESLFNHYRWTEEEVNNVLINKYNWEIATDSPTTWRIGDGTAAFYNYLYLYYTGFTEHDTFRSNQIRNNQITREKALELLYKDNVYRRESLKWYFDTIDVDANQVFNKVLSQFSFEQKP